MHKELSQRIGKSSLKSAASQYSKWKPVLSSNTRSRKTKTIKNTTKRLLKVMHSFNKQQNEFQVIIMVTTDKMVTIISYNDFVLAVSPFHFDF